MCIPTRARKVIRRIKLTFRVFFGMDFYIKPNYSCNTIRLGSDYGGWVVPENTISDKSIVYSFGIGKDISFDLDLIANFGSQVFGFDPTPDSIRWVKQQKLPSNFQLYEFGLAATDGTLTFYPPKDKHHISHTLLDRPETANNAINVPVKRLSSIIRELEHKRVDVLKLDIEGAEYEVLDDLVASKIRPKLLLVEFHHRFSGVSPQQTQKSIQRLFANGYSLFHVSDTNEEFSFLYEPDHQDIMTED